MKHICDNIVDYTYAMATALDGDTVYCTYELWKKINESQGLSLCKRLVYEEDEK